MGKKQRKLKVYICYPFEMREYNNYDVLRQTIAIVYRLGYIPIISTQYIVPHENPLYGTRVNYQTIEMCDALLLCYEEDATEVMFKEMHAALLRGKPIIRSIAL